MSSAPLSRRSLIKAAALAGGTVAFGLPQALWPATAETYSVDAKMDWWYQARFGMFIHFGSYSYLGRGEWAFSADTNPLWTKAGYQSQVTQNFNPNAFNAATIAQLAQNAGMKYLVITAKHHEGYAMWDSDVPGFKDATGTKLYNLHDFNNFQPDLLAQLKTECESRGIKFGLYYSILDWNHPSQTVDRPNYYSDMSSLSARTGYINDMKAQLQELLNRYDPAVLWFDGDWYGNPSTPDLDQWWGQADGKDLYDWLMARKPNLIVNERVKRDHGLGDYAVAEFGIPDAPLDRPWEACATMNDAWGYVSWKENQYRSVQTIIREMVTVVSRDGNYLLNIGPKGDGSVTAGSVTVLNGMGSWMATHGDSIHGTSGSPFATDPSWGRVTKKNGKLFAHVFDWPTGGTLQIPAVYNTINRVYLMNNPGTNLNYWASGGQINVSVPSTAPNANDSVVCVEVNGMPAVLAGGVYRLICAQSGKALDNGNIGNDGSPIIQWTANGGSPQQWTVTDLGHGYYKLVCVRSGKALDDNNSTSDSGVMVQRTDNGSHQQQWAVTALGNGAFRLINRHSGKALDNANNGADNTQVIQWTPNGGAPQQWNMTKVG
ncbi:alpha-L-fucosidase [Streptomyces sp. NBC_00882]|uniref:alpha-L-fucosidase n=1 Tax=Streptomyces TaxID=1883 RepID=UPI0038696FE6|nr:alpha-L-fucosidase [Streptomyces sp. NBC_00882]WSZ63199.1 alpha-L-fucosidase [Streptomyces canus]